MMDSMEWAVCQRAMPGESVCGDDYLARSVNGVILLAVADGLGHGPRAAIASGKAMSALREHTWEGLEQGLQMCHQQLFDTRGAALTVACIDTLRSQLEWCGVGNVEALLYRAGNGECERLLLRGGIVGYRLPRLLCKTTDIHRGDILIFATDGIFYDFPEAVDWASAPQAMADSIIAISSKKTDDALVLVARYVGKDDGK